MTNLKDLIDLLAPHQKPFRPINVFSVSAAIIDQVRTDPVKSKSKLMSMIQAPIQDIGLKIKQKYKLINDIEISYIGKKYSLYTSILSQIQPNFNLCLVYHEKLNFIKKFIDFVIYKITVDPKIKDSIKRSKLKADSLTTELKNINYQSPVILYLLSIILDLNIIVWNETLIPELYYAEDEYDNCKAHILLYRNINQIYSPISIGPETLLTYYDHPIIRQVMDGFEKKIIY